MKRGGVERAQPVPRQADVQRWHNLQYVDGYGPLGLCDCCVEPLETLGALNAGRCAACAAARREPTGESAAQAAAYNAQSEDHDGIS